MPIRTLVTYATRCGSTREVAQAIAAELEQRGGSVDLLPLQQAARLAEYDAVVLGSAVRFGRWLPEALKFVEQNRAALNQKQTAVFTVHLMNLGDDEASRTARQAYLDPVRALVTPAAEAFFAGVGDSSKVSFLERIIAKMVKSPEGDFRNWDAIRSWGRSIPA